MDVGYKISCLTGIEEVGGIHETLGLADRHRDRRGCALGVVGRAIRSCDVAIPRRRPGGDRLRRISWTGSGATGGSAAEVEHQRLATAVVGR